MSRSEHPGGRQSDGAAPEAPPDPVDQWYVKATETGLVVAGRVGSRTKAVDYVPDNGTLNGVLVSQRALDAMEHVHASRVPTPARDYVRELHALHEQAVAAIAGTDENGGER